MIFFVLFVLLLGLGLGGLYMALSTDSDMIVRFFLYGALGIICLAVAGASLHKGMMVVVCF